MNEERPTFSEAVIGFRAWKLADDGTLWPRSISGLERLCAEPWEPGPNRARCVYVGFSRSPHPVPGADCDCGLYAHHTVGELRRYRREDDVLGAVAAWGDMQVHRTGFRAQYAQVVALVAVHDTARAGAVRWAADRHGVMLVGQDDLDKEVTAHGSPLSPDHLPAPSLLRRALGARRHGAPRRTHATQGEAR